jgi:phosphopantetheinyl transferase (holo-ACP synthase)
MANEREVGRIWISLSHTEESGMATIILEAHDR